MEKAIGSLLFLIAAGGLTMMMSLVFGVEAVFWGVWLSIMCLFFVVAMGAAIAIFRGKL